MDINDDGVLLAISPDDIINGYFTVPYEVTRINARVFFDYRNLEGINPSARLIEVGDCAFIGCISLKTLDAGFTVIGPNAFSCCNYLTSVRLHPGLTQIGMGAFSFCPRLNEVRLPAGLQELGVRAFICCTSLEFIKLPEGLTRVDQEAFLGCKQLTRIEIPAELTYFAPDALAECDNLKMIIINSDDPKNVERIKNLFPVALQGKVIARNEYEQQMISGQKNKFFAVVPEPVVGAHVSSSKPSFGS